MENALRKKIARGEPVFGVLVAMNSPDHVEFIGHLGFDYILIDAEHGIIGPESCLALVRACHAVGMTAIVRVPVNSPSVILSYLETGVMGVLVPHVNSADDARAAVDAIRFAPVGRRGAYSSSRLANYELTQTPAEYYARANEEILVFVLVEELQGVENIDEIAAVEGVYGVHVGRGDLSMSLGLPGLMEDPQVDRVVAHARSRIKAAGKIVPVTIVSGDGKTARRAVEEGAHMVALKDSSLFAPAALQYLADAHGE